MSQLLLAWVLMVPLVVLAVHMQFSFLHGLSNSDEGQTLASQLAAPDDGMGNVYRGLLYSAYVVVGWLIFTNLPRVLRAISECKPALLVCGIVLASAIWSQEPRISLHDGRYYFLDTFFAFYLLTAFSLEELMELMMMLGTTLAILSAVMIVAFPQYGLMHQTAHLNNWQGIFSHKNVAAENYVFLLTPVCNRRIFQPRCMVYAGIILLFIAMAHSVTAIVACALYVVFMMCLPFFRRMSLRSMVFLIAASILMTVLSAFLLIGMTPQLAGFLGRDLTLTGRTDIWALLLQSAHKHPLLGYGYQAFWTGMDGESGQVYMTLHWIFTSAHNGFLEILLQVGMIGLAAVLLMLLKAMANAFVCVRNEDSAGIDWLVGLLFLTLLYNFDESSLLFPHTLVSVIFVMACGGLAMARARVRERASAVDGVDRHAAEVVAYA
jgi:O-antigen ligase